MKFGERVRLARITQRLTQKQVAVRAKTSQGTVSFVERGAEVEPAVLRRIAKVVGIEDALSAEQGRQAD